MKKELYAFFAVVLFSLPLIRQTGHLSAQPVTTCENSNFNLGTFKGWQGCYGYFGKDQIPGYPAPPPYGACASPGFLVNPIPPLYDNPLHKIIAAPGWPASSTCGNLPSVFPGEDFVVRIGDTAYTGGTWPTGKEAEMRYGVTVSNDSYLFIYRYAVVLQNGGHAPALQPDFQVMITDNAGNVLDSTCGYYYIAAPPTGQTWPGWHTCVSDVSWKDWTTVGLDLTSYFGQTVYINFKVRGCYYDTHFGYAMISAYCGMLQLQTALCQGDTSATLTAPPGFTYLWSTGDTTQFIVVPNPVTGAQYSCTLTAVNGCQVTITENLTYTETHANFTHGIPCAGIPVQFTDSSWVNQNWVTNWVWDFGDGTPPDTGVANPMHTFNLPGTYDVKLVAFSTEGCNDSIVKQIHVDSVPHVTNQPLVITLCSHDSTYLILTSDLPATLFTWTAASNSPLITGYSDNAIPTTLLNQVLVNTGPLSRYGYLHPVSPGRRLHGSRYHLPGGGQPGAGADQPSTAGQVHMRQHLHRDLITEQQRQHPVHLDMHDRFGQPVRFRG